MLAWGFHFMIWCVPPAQSSLCFPFCVRFACSIVDPRVRLWIFSFGTRYDCTQFAKLYVWCDNTANWWPEFPVAIAILFTTCVMASIIRDVYKKEQAAKKWRMSNADGSRPQSTISKFFWQSLWCECELFHTFDSYYSLDLLLFDQWNLLHPSNPWRLKTCLPFTQPGCRIWRYSSCGPLGKATPRTSSPSSPPRSFPCRDCGTALFTFAEEQRRKRQNCWKKFAADYLPALPIPHRTAQDFVLVFLASLVLGRHPPPSWSDIHAVRDYDQQPKLGRQWDNQYYTTFSPTTGPIINLLLLLLFWVNIYKPVWHVFGLQRGRC